MSTEQHAKDMHQEVVMYLSGNKKQKTNNKWKLFCFVQHSAYGFSKLFFLSRNDR